MSQKLPQPILKNDFDNLLENIKQERDLNWMPRKKKYNSAGERIQDFIIAVCLGFGAGMRISEICGLKKKQKYIYTLKDGTQKNEILISNILPLTFDRIENNFIRIKGGKGQKDRTVPLPTKVFKKVGITRSELENKLPLKTKYRTIEKMTTKYGKQILNKHITFHMLRHGFVSHLLSSGMPIHQVQAFAGHSRMDTTGLYAHTNPKEALKSYEEFF